jgi:hypothetical protein
MWRQIKKHSLAILCMHTMYFDHGHLTSPFLIPFHCLLLPSKVLLRPTGVRHGYSLELGHQANSHWRDLPSLSSHQLPVDAEGRGRSQELLSRLWCDADKVRFFFNFLLFPNSSKLGTSPVTQGPLGDASDPNYIKAVWRNGSGLERDGCFAKGQGSVPSTHMVVHNSMQLWCQKIWCSFLASLDIQHTCCIHIYMKEKYPQT